jgi:outer membrane protein OmpA-like peptidoglycan-associated protein
MRVFSGSMVLSAAAVALVSGCATTGALRKATEQQQAALAAQQTAQQAALTSAVSAEKAERAASDSALRQDLGLVRGDITALRTELQTMKTDFGAKIAAVEQGMQFALPVNFAFNADQVRDEDHAALDRFSQIVTKYYPGSKVTIEGFADPKGSTRYNLDLSRRRAEAVKAYLGSKGLTGNEISTIGYGKTRLVTPGAWGDKPGADLNRRVVFVIESKGQRAVSLAPETPQ